MSGNERSYLPAHNSSLMVGLKLQGEGQTMEFRVPLLQANVWSTYQGNYSNLNVLLINDMITTNACIQYTLGMGTTDIQKSRQLSNQLLAQKVGPVNGQGNYFP